MLSRHPHPRCFGIGLLLLLGFLVVDGLTQMEEELPVWYNPYSSPVTEAPTAEPPVTAVVPTQSQGHNEDRGNRSHWSVYNHYSPYYTKYPNSYPYSYPNPYSPFPYYSSYGGQHYPLLFTYSQDVNVGSGDDPWMVLLAMKMLDIQIGDILKPLQELRSGSGGEKLSSNEDSNGNIKYEKVIDMMMIMKSLNGDDDTYPMMIMMNKMINDAPMNEILKKMQEIMMLTSVVTGDTESLMTALMMKNVQNATAVDEAVTTTTTTTTTTTSTTTTTAPRYCDPATNDWTCCSSIQPCGLGEGDCDADDECKVRFKIMIMMLIFLTN